MADEEILLLKKYIKDELSNSSQNDIESFLQTIKHASKSKEFTEVNKYLLGIKTKVAEEKKKKEEKRQNNGKKHNKHTKQHRKHTKKKQKTCKNSIFAVNSL